MKKHRVAGIILAGGSGSRMESDITKQRMMLGGMTVLQRCALAFDECEDVDYLVIVVKKDEMDLMTQELSSKIKKPFCLIPGGSCRAESAIAGFNAARANADYVAIHDAARCLITPQMISKVVRDAYSFGASTAVGAVFDTLKTVDDEGFVTATLCRDFVFKAQTPQVFSAELYSRALEAYSGELFSITDDNMLLESLGVSVHSVDLGPSNIKITTREDLLFAELILEQRGAKDV